MEKDRDPMELLKRIDDRLERLCKVWNVPTAVQVGTGTSLDDFGAKDMAELERQSRMLASGAAEFLESEPSVTEHRTVGETTEAAPEIVAQHKAAKPDWPVGQPDKPKKGK